MKDARSEFESDFLSNRMTLALVLRGGYEEIRRLKRDLLEAYELDIAYHEVSENRRYITDKPPEGVDSDGEGKR